MLTQGSLLTISEVLSPSEHLVFCFCGLIRRLPKKIDVLEFANNYHFFKGKDDVLEIVQLAMKGPRTYVIRYAKRIRIVEQTNSYWILTFDGYEWWNHGPTTDERPIDIIKRINKK